MLIVDANIVLRYLLLDNKGDNIHTYDSDILNKALEIFSSKKIDFVDTLLCGYSLVRGDEVKTFDNQINKFISKEKEKSGKNASEDG